MPRTNTLARLRVGDIKFNMEMIENDWGPEDPILHQILNGSFDEHQSILWWLFFVRRSPVAPTVLDVGAYTGLFSLVAARARHDATVVAYEPSAATWGRFARNIQLSLCDGQILAANLAAGDSKSTLVFNHPYGIFTLCPGESALSEKNIEFSQTVISAPLDDVLEEKSKRGDYINAASYSFLPPANICAVKIDVEGAEISVLNGSRNIIERHRPFFIAEALSRQAEDGLANLFSKFDYGYIPLREERNLIFIPSEKRAGLEAEFQEWKNNHARDGLIRGNILHSYDVSEL